MIDKENPEPGTGLEQRLRAAWAERARDSAQARMRGEKLLDEAYSVGDNRCSALALLLLAWTELARSENAAARRYAEESITLAHGAGDDVGESMALSVLGQILFRYGESREAVARFRHALDLAERADDDVARAMALAGNGRVLDETGSYEQAMASYRHALESAGRAGADDEIGMVLLGIGNVHENLAEYQQALEEYLRALEIAERTGNVQCQAYATGNIGLIYKRFGDLSTSLAYELRSLDLKEHLGDRWAAGVSLNNIGLIYGDLGNYARSLDYLLRALEYAEGIGDRSGEMIALHNINQVYEILGDQRPVLDHYERVQQIAREIGDKRGEAFAHGNTGRVHARLGDHRRALFHMLHGLRIHQEIGDRLGERSALENIAQLYQTQGDFQRAAQYAGQSLALAESVGDYYSVIRSLISLGAAESSGGNHAHAIELLERALQLAREGNYARDLMTISRLLAESCDVAGDMVRSRKYHRLYQEYTRRTFNHEEALRMRRLITGFERKRMRDKAELLGLPAEDLDALFEPDEPEGTVQGTTVSREPREKTSRISVQTFGELRVTVDGRALRTADWGRRKARDLFKFFVIHHRRTVTMDEIIEKLWEGAAGRSTELLVMNAISRIRRALEPERGPRDRNSMLSSTEGTYRLDLGDPDIDFMRFKELIVLARGASGAGERYGYYQDAIAFYSDDFLKEDYNEEWTISERELLKDAFIEALEYMAGESLRAGRYEEAGELARRLILSDATSERGYEILMQSLLARGRSTEAVQVYEDCRAVFLRDLGAPPPDAITRILQSVSAAPRGTATTVQ